MRSSIFQITNQKNLKDFCPKSLKLNQKVVKITLSTYDKPSLNMQKNGSDCPISRDIQFQNFQGRNPSNF